MSEIAVEKSENKSERREGNVRTRESLVGRFCIRSSWRWSQNLIFVAMIRIGKKDFLKYGLEMVGMSTNRQNRTCEPTKLERFRSHYGCGPTACRKIFRDLQRTNIASARIDNPDYHHFLVALNWLATYKKEAEMATFFDMDEKTSRKKVKKYVSAIAALKKTKIRWIDAEDSETFVVSVDGVHCAVNEPRLMPSDMWFSHKEGGAGVVYELGVHIRLNQITWVNGPFKAGYPDSSIFLGEHAERVPKKIGDDGKDRDEVYESLYDKIPAGKKAVADRLYKGKCLEKCAIRNDLDTAAARQFKKRVRARHENLNARIKNFRIVRERFRHGVKNHRMVFEAVCVVVQYEIENDNPLMDV